LPGAARRVQGPWLAVYTEIHSTLARRLRETLPTDKEHNELVDRFERDLESVIAVSVRPVLIGRVLRLGRQHPCHRGSGTAGERWISSAPA